MVWERMKILEMILLSGLYRWRQRKVLEAAAVDQGEASQAGGDSTEFGRDSRAPRPSAHLGRPGKGSDDADEDEAGVATATNTTAAATTFTTTPTAV